MDSAPFPLDFEKFGFSNPTPEFLMVTTGDDEGRAAVEGVVVIPGLPVCRVRMRTDTERLFRYGPGRRALIAYVRAALHEDIARELPVN
ncbi:hypothetical protein [Rubricoccus marinus]|uniref:Uncharacterized protein n=1 Tax=Rubricoccus marinus TaxID=716817 RepID=A0A259TYC0_9BACT|nr:hypothetical protein [Rubricoccus marinus]OZC02690.1 hypothetical protein BSZ36_06695 [Rubricoccus marinus]